MVLSLSEVARAEGAPFVKMDVDLMVLQERCRKDPQSYMEEFVCQQRHFEALLTAAALRPSDLAPRLAEVASFMGAVAVCYGTAGSEVAPRVAAFLAEAGIAMDPDLRRSLVRLLGLLRARDAADAKVVIPLFFRLLQCNDKVLRRMLHGHIVSDIKRMQIGGGGRRLQSFLFAMVEDPSEVLVKRSLHVLIDLFRKRIWNDSRCANMIASACFHPATPVALIATKFLLDAESKEDDGDDSDVDDDVGTSRGRKSYDGHKASDMWKAYNMTGKKSSKKRRRMERVINNATRVKSVSSKGAVHSSADHEAFAAMMLLNDPQEFAERLFSDLQTRRRKEKYEDRLVFINLLTRLIGTHQLIIFNVYPFLQRYLQPAQPEVTRVLAYLTQACHEMVTSDVLHPILRGLADNFVSERSSPPSVAAGLNTIRAICARVPLAILDPENEDKPEEEQESPLLEDLVQYKTNRDKGVVMGARSLISLYREVHPRLLHKRDRGRSATEAVQKGVSGFAPAYGAHKFVTGVDGVELLAENETDDEDEADGEEIEGIGGDDEDAVEEEDEAHDEDGEEEKEGVEVDGNDYEAEEEAGVEGDATRQDQVRILTDADFARIRARAAARAVEGVVGSKLRRRVEVDTGDAVDPEELQGPIKRERRNLAERMESVLAGREGREKFGSNKGKNKGGGSTNQKKLKTKANSMVIHKRRKKAKMGRREKQLSKSKKKLYKTHC